MGLILAAILLLVVGFGAYVRLAPSDPARWHVDPFAAADPGQAGALVRETFANRTPEALLADLAAIAAATPRTTRLAGDPASGRITWITRTKVWGFPDYTTAAARQGADGQTELAILARLRFGGGDLGVNRARVTAWLKALQAAQ